MRTALSQFSFSLIILKVFNSDFYPIGALFAVYGAAIMLVAIYRRYEGNRQFFDGDEDPDGSVGIVGKKKKTKKFRTSGNSVTLLTILSFVAYLGLVVLVLNLTS
jgi:hypothetical protein